MVRHAKSQVKVTVESYFCIIGVVKVEYKSQIFFGEQHQLFEKIQLK